MRRGIDLMHHSRQLIGQTRKAPDSPKCVAHHLLVQTRDNCKHNMLFKISAGIEMKAELQRIGFLGKEKCIYIDMPLTAHFELHMRRGRILSNGRGRRLVWLVEFKQ